MFGRMLTIGLVLAGLLLGGCASSGRGSDEDFGPAIGCLVVGAVIGAAVASAIDDDHHDGHHHHDR